MPVKNIIFDLGGVIMNLDYLKTINEFVLLGYPQFKLDFSQAKQSSVFDSIEQGKCDTIQALKDTFNLDLTDKEIIAAWNKMILDIPIERIRYIEELKAEGYKIYLFSNINSVHLDQVFNELNRVYSVEKWNKLFDKVFYSFEIGFNKPYADAFEYVLSIVGDRKETLFLDDTKRHVEGALSVGLNAVLIEDGVSIFDTRSIARTIVSGLFEHRKASLPMKELLNIDKGFLLLIGSTYFAQGFRAYAFSDGIIWFYSHNFNLNPGPVQVYLSIISITWNIKMIYGLIFDNFPLFNLHNQPYLLIASVSSLLGFLSLGFPALSNTPESTIAGFWFGLMGMAMCDVIADAMVVKHARDLGEKGGADLQTFCWIMQGIGSIVGRPVAGIVNGSDGSGSRFLLGVVYSIVAFFNVLVCFFVKEKPSTIKWSIYRVLNQIKKLLVTLTLKRIYLPMIWIVLSSAVIPDISAAMNFWKRNVIGIGADDQAFIDTIGDAFSIFGLVLYNLFYKNTPYRKIFFYTQILASLFMFSDVILVNRWNKYLYIPDYIFLIGSHTIINTIFSLQGMPVLVMAAQMCPKEIEATFFSTVMSLFNTGGTLSALYGGVLLDFLHIVKIKNELDSNNENYDFHNIIVAVWIRIIGCLVPAFLALYMLPNSNVIETVDDESYQVIEMDNLADEDKMFSIEDEEEEDLNYDDTYSFTKSHDS